MPTVPLGLRSYNRTSAFQPEVELVNLYLEEDKSGASPDKFMRIQRPGLSSFATVSASIRGLYGADGVVGGAWVACYGTTLATLDPAVTVLGSVPAGGNVAFAGTFERLTILSEGEVSLWDGATLTVLAMPLGEDVVDIEAINGYLIFLTVSGMFYWLAPGETVVDPLNFADAESSADGGVAVRRLVDELWFFGKNSIEPWQPTGDIDAPFQKAAGRQFERGALARDTVRRFDNSLVWVGEDLIVYRGGAVPERISEHGIEERLRKRTDDPTAWTLGTDGHKFYVLRIPGQGTFAFDAATSAWSEFASTGSDTWKPHVGANSGTTTVAGDYASGAVWLIDEAVSNDDGIEMRRAVTGTVPVVGRPGRNDSLSIGVGSEADCTVKVRWKDGRDDYPDDFEELEARAGADILNIYRLGMVDQPFRTFEIEVTDDVAIRISGAKVNEAFQ
jgi:hypothetical protein